MGILWGKNQCLLPTTSVPTHCQQLFHVPTAVPCLAETKLLLPKSHRSNCWERKPPPQDPPRSRSFPRILRTQSATPSKPQIPNPTPQNSPPNTSPERPAQSPACSLECSGVSCGARGVNSSSAALRSSWTEASLDPLRRFKRKPFQQNGFRAVDFPSENQIGNQRDRCSSPKSKANVPSKLV